MIKYSRASPHHIITRVKESMHHHIKLRHVSSCIYCHQHCNTFTLRCLLYLNIFHHANTYHCTLCTFVHSNIQSTIQTFAHFTLTVHVIILQFTNTVHTHTYLVTEELPKSLSTCSRLQD